MIIEKTGWSQIDISASALDDVADALGVHGVEVSELDVAPLATAFRAYLQLPAYCSEYRSYGGQADHCLLEKSLEHFLSIHLLRPQHGQTFVDVGSCRSVVPGILRDVYSARCYEQDLVYPVGVNGNQIGSNADAIPLEPASVDGMMLHCTFEHFERDADTGFVHETSRLLKPGASCVILPLYLNPNYCNITGETDRETLSSIGFDPEADHYCSIPEWQNRFGRHYSPKALIDRVLKPAINAGLGVELSRVRHWESVHKDLWLRWVLVLTKHERLNVDD